MKIETHHLIKRYGERTVVNDVNVEVEQEQLWVCSGLTVQERPQLFI